MGETVTEDLQAKYREDILGWPWDEIIAEAMGNAETDPDDEGQEIGSCHLGTIQGLTPSGKMYTPWAAGNLDSCEKCQGKGDIPNPQHNIRKFEKAQEMNRSLTRKLLDAHGAHPNWPDEDKARLERLRAQEQKYRENLECEHCGSLGCREAFEDQEWTGVLEAVAEEKGGFVDGDSGDINFSLTITKDCEES